MKHILLLSLLFIIQVGNTQVVLEGSDLPIVIINTFGAEIEREERIAAEIKIIFRDSAQRNLVNDTKYHYRGRVSIKYRGNSSFALFPKKSYSFETQDADGKNDNVSLLDMPKENDWILYSPFSDKSLMRNALTYNIAGQIMDYAPRTKFCEVIVDNQYQGVYLLTEKIKRDKNRVNISDLKKSDIEGDQLTGGYIIKIDKGGHDEIAWTSKIVPLSRDGKPTNFLFEHPEASDIKQEQLNYIQTYVEEFESSLTSFEFNDPLIGYEKYIDVESFIDYSLINELTRNVDGYRLSTFLYKDRDSIDGRLKIGPVWDFNIALGNADYCHGGATKGWAWDFNEVCENDKFAVPFWWNRFLQNPRYIERLVSRWQELRMSVLATESLMNKIDSMSQHLDESQKRNFLHWEILDEYVWPNNYVGGSYKSEITYLKNWLNWRLEWLDQAFEELVVIEPESKLVSVKVYPNPMVDEFNIYFTLMDPAHIVRVALYDAQGKQVFMSNELHPTSNNNYHFKENISFPSGVYFYQVYIDNQVEWSGPINVLHQQ